MTSDNTLSSGGAARRGDASRTKFAINADNTPWYVYAAVIAFGIAAPIVFPAYTTQITFLWMKGQNSMRSQS